MSTVSLDDLKRDPLALLARVAAGEQLVIAQDGRPVAELRPPPAPGSRPYGLCAGEFVVPDDFDAPLPTDLLNEFGGP
jgi:prevent-host-death family protein